MRKTAIRKRSPAENRSEMDDGRAAVAVEPPDYGIDFVDRGLAAEIAGTPASFPIFQPKLIVGAPDDPAEREADRVAEQVLRMPEPEVVEEEARRGPLESEEEKLRRQPLEEEEELRRQPLEEEEELRRQPLEEEEDLRRQPVDEEEELRSQPLEEEEEILRAKPGPRGPAPPVSQTTAAKIGSLRGKGEPLARSSLAFFQPRFGADLSGVRIHRGAPAAETSRAVRARAFTFGRDIAFGSGEYRPESASGQRLLAHELAHVVQQSRDVSAPAVQRQTAAQPPATVAAPTIRDLTLGEWGETLSSATLVGGELLRNPESGDGGFGSVSEAQAWAGPMIAQQQQDGGVIIKYQARYFAYAMQVESWISSFSRANLEGGFDTLSTEGAQVADIQAFVTGDGYAAPPTVARAGSLADTVHIVERRLAGGHWRPTKLPQTEDFAATAAALREGGSLGLDATGAVALFKTMVKAEAMKRLEENRKHTHELQQQYSDTSEGSPRFSRLRELAEKDRALAGRRGDLKLLIGLGRVRMSGADPLFMSDTVEQILAENAEHERQIDEIDATRAALRGAFPALSVIDTADLQSRDNAAIGREMARNLAEIRDFITEVEHKVHEDDVPLNEMGPVLEAVKTQLGVSTEKRDSGDPVSQGIIGWLESEGFKDGVIRWGGTGVTIVLTVAAIFASGGWALLLLAAGAITGFGTAAYDFERAADLYDAARSSEAGGRAMVTDPEQAKADYWLGVVNLVLAGLDLGLAARAGSKLASAATRSRRLASSRGAALFETLSPEDIQKFEEVARLREAGKTAKADRLLEELTSRLGQRTANQADELFRRAAAKEVVLSRHPNVDVDELDQVLAGIADAQRAGMARGVADDAARIVQELAGNPRIKGLDSWIESVARHTDVEHYLDRLNELREARRKVSSLVKGETIDLGETKIPGGTARTADLTIGTLQTEVKTVREAITSATGVDSVTGQLADALEKFATATGRGPFEAVIYARYDEALLASRKIGRGPKAPTQVLARDGKLTKAIPDEAPVVTDFWNDLDTWLQSGLGRREPKGIDRVHTIIVRLENGVDQMWIRLGSKWVRQ